MFCSSAYFSDLRIENARQRVVCELGPINLALGSYEIDARVCKPMTTWLEEHDAVIEFRVDRQCAATRGFELLNTRQLGAVIPDQRWRIETAQ